MRLVLTKLDVFECRIEEHDIAPVFNRYVREDPAPLRLDLVTFRQRTP